jgi:hypothetical protein
MDKVAFSAHYGRELALRLFLESEGNELQKEASAGNELDETQVVYLNDLASSLEYREHQQKVAHNNGAFEALAKVAAALESGEFSADDLYEEIGTAMENIKEASELLLPESDDENGLMLDVAIKNAAVTLAQLHETEVDESIFKVAEHLVLSQIAQDTDEDDA